MYKQRENIGVGFLIIIKIVYWQDTVNISRVYNQYIQELKAYIECFKI